jgi:citrate lyase subunit alpha / citrate CoA-transferase
MPVNALGRALPEEIKGYQAVVPYSSPSGAAPPLRKAPAYAGRAPVGGSKLLPGITEAIRQCGLKDGMTLSFHHHFRNGDRVLNQVLEAAARLGLKGLKVAASSIFPVHAPLVDHIKNGTVAQLSCNYMLGPVAEAVSRGALSYPVVFRTHGGRDRAIEAGEERIDAAFLAASAADPAGNCNGTGGPAACGSLGYCMSDARYARKTVVLAGSLAPYPLAPASIDETLVDYVVKLEPVGDPAGIATGAVKLQPGRTALAIAGLAAELIEASGLLKDGFSFQAGTGGTALAVAGFLRDKMVKHGITGSFGMGGITAYMVELLRDGFFRCLLDTQSFDREAVRSLAENPRHVEISSSRYANPHNKGCAVNSLDIMILSATEVDVDFNVNVHTASSGLVIGGSGGHADTAAGAKLAVVVAPTVRGSTPIIIDRVLTVTTPGETIGCVVTECGVAVNPRLGELGERLRAAGLPVKDIRELRAAAEKAAGRPAAPRLSGRIVGVVEYRDGSVIDVIRALE